MLHSPIVVCPRGQGKVTAVQTEQSRKQLDGAIFLLPNGTIWRCQTVVFFFNHMHKEGLWVLCFIL
jgi:hypothetical protein